MKTDTNHCCKIMAQILSENRAHISYEPQLREYYIDMRNEPMVGHHLYYCPWCSIKLPKSLRDEWFDTLKIEYNLDNPWKKEQENLVPDEFKSDEWWKKRGL